MVSNTLGKVRMLPNGTEWSTVILHSSWATRKMHSLPEFVPVGLVFWTLQVGLWSSSGQRHMERACMNTL